jgi:hypothetical protein
MRVFLSNIYNMFMTTITDEDLSRSFWPISIIDVSVSETRVVQVYSYRETVLITNTQQPVHCTVILNYMFSGSSAFLRDTFK